MLDDRLKIGGFYEINYFRPLWVRLVEREECLLSENHEEHLLEDIQRNNVRREFTYTRRMFVRELTPEEVMRCLL